MRNQYVLQSVKWIQLILYRAVPSWLAVKFIGMDPWNGQDSISAFAISSQHRLKVKFPALPL